MSDNMEGYAWALVAATGFAILLGAPPPPTAGAVLVTLAVLRGLLRLIRIFQEKADEVPRG